MSKMPLSQALDLGFQHLQAGLLDEAETVGRAILTVAPTEIRAYQIVYTVYVLRGNWPAAEEAIRGWLALDPQAAEAQHQLGNVFRVQNRWAEAAEAYRAALAITPDRVDIQAQLAEAVAKQG